MKILTRILFCIFAVTIFNSCEPEDISENQTSGDIGYENETISESGDEKGGVVYKEE